MEVKSQVDDNGNPKKYKAMVSTSTSEFSIMTTDCPVNMCQINEEIKYDYTLAPDE